MDDTAYGTNREMIEGRVQKGTVAGRRQVFFWTPGAQCVCGERVVFSLTDDIERAVKRERTRKDQDQDYEMRRGLTRDPTRARRGDMRAYRSPSVVLFLSSLVLSQRPGVGATCLESLKERAPVALSNACCRLNEYNPISCRLEFPFSSPLLDLPREKKEWERNMCRE